MKIIVATLLNFLQKSAFIALGHCCVEGGRAVLALLLAATSLSVEMVMSRDARDDFTALGDAKTFAE